GSPGRAGELQRSSGRRRRTRIHDHRRSARPGRQPALLRHERRRNDLRCRQHLQRRDARVGPGAVRRTRPAVAPPAAASSDSDTVWVLHGGSMQPARRVRALTLVAALVTLAATVPPAQKASPVTAPKKFSGFNIGDDYQLANYTQFSDYVHKLEKETSRMKVVEI